MPLTKEALAIIGGFKEQYLSKVADNNFDRDLWTNLKTLSASVDDSDKTGTVISSIIIPKNYSNHLGITAGGAVAHLFDGLTTSAMAIIAKKGFWDGKEMTRKLDITYYRPIPMEEELVIECRIVDAGRSVAAITGVMRRASDEVLLASCQHDKIYPVQAKLPWDDLCGVGNLATLSKDILAGVDDFGSQPHRSPAARLDTNAEDYLN